MQTLKHAGHTKPLLSQTKNNTTLWIGHLKADPTDHFAGQTFFCNAGGKLDNIQVFTEAVQLPGEIILHLHAFDAAAKTWGRELCTAQINVHKTDHSKWMRFELPAVELKSGICYGFRLETKDAMVAIGEAATDAKQPFIFGQEWKADSKNINGNFFSYFSLAFKIELCA